MNTVFPRVRTGVVVVIRKQTAFTYLHAVVVKETNDVHAAL